MRNNRPNTMAVDFKLKQQEFVAYIRNPEQHPAPDDVDLTRVSMYRELLFNNIDNFLASNFPVLRKIHDDPQWTALVQDFFAQHHSTTPYFSEIAEEFLSFLQNERGTQAQDYPFLLELAHYEWVETVLMIDETQLAPNPTGLNLLDQVLSISPLAWPLAYLYPVHKIAPGYLPSTPAAEPTFLIVYRNPDDEVHFLEINALTYSLLELIQQNPTQNAYALLKQLAEQVSPHNPNKIINTGVEILMAMYEKNIICLG